MHAQPAPHPTRAVLAQPGLRRFAASRFCRSFADTLLGASVAWHLFAATRSAFALGALGLVEFLPVIPVGLVAGAVADTRDRLRIVQLAQLAVLGLSLALVASAGLESPELPLLGLAFWVAVATCFERPAGAALLPRLVPTHLFSAAVVVVGNVRNAAWAVGPVVAGLAIERWGPGAAYGIAAAFLAASVALLLGLPSPGAKASGERFSAEAVREGLRFVWRRREVLAAMTLDLFAVLFASVVGILPIFASDVLQVGARGYGLLSASLTIGTFLMAIALLLRPGLERPGRALIGAVGVFGAATVVFAVSGSFALSVAALIVAGMADQVSMVTRETIVQLSTPDEMRGRVSSVNFVFIGASNELGAAESALLAGLTSARFSALFGGIACLAVLAWIGLRMPELRSTRSSG